MRGLLLFLFIFSGFCSPFAAAAGVPWLFSKPKSNSFKVTLEDLRKGESWLDNHVKSVSLNVDFGESFDRITLESKDFPVLDGKEVFRGRIKSFALNEKNLVEVRRSLNSDILKRVDFFQSHLNKNFYVDPRVRKQVMASSQSFFMDDSKTYIFDYSDKQGLSLLKMNKVYERPAEIEVLRSQGDYGRRHFHVSVRTHRPGFAWSEEMNQEIEARDTGHIYYQSFMDHLRTHRQRAVFEAVQSLVERQNQKLTYPDRVNLRKIDEYLMSLNLVDQTAEILVGDSMARSVRDALEMRLLLYGGEPFESWVFQYDPIIQEPELDHIPFEGDYKSAQAFISTDRGFLLARSHSAVSFLIEPTHGNGEELQVLYYMPAVGMSSGDAITLRVNTTPTRIESLIAKQVKSGLQGNSDYYRYMLDDVLTSCARHLKE